jgi:hypothetical protein
MGHRAWEGRLGHLATVVPFSTPMETFSGPATDGICFCNRGCNGTNFVLQQTGSCNKDVSATVVILQQSRSESSPVAASLMKQLMAARHAREGTDGGLAGSAHAGQGETHGRQPLGRRHGILLGAFQGRMDCGVGATGETASTRGGMARWSWDHRTRGTNRLSAAHWTLVLGHEVRDGGAEGARRNGRPGGGGRRCAHGGPRRAPLDA